MPRVSVFIASYNHEKYVRDCIQSVLDQTYQDFEIVITDDGSTDGTVNVIKEFNDPRIQLYTHAENKGASTAANNCIQKATGEYLAGLNSDDAWEPTKLEKQVKYLDSHPEIGAVFTKVAFVDEAGNLIGPEDYKNFYIFEKENRSRYEWLKFFFSTGNCLCHPSVLIRKKCYDEVGLYDERMANIPDQDMWTRLCLKYDIHILSEKLVRFRILTDKSSASADKPSTHIRISFEYIQILNHYLAIDDREIFLKIFPEAEKYGVVEKEYIPYFLSRLALDIGTRTWYLWGVQTLFNFLGQAGMEIGLEKKYGFRYTDFYNLTAQHDIFNIESVKALGASLREKVSQTRRLESHTHRLESKIHRLESEIQRLESKIQQIQQSIPMQLANRYQRCIDKWLRPGTRRRHYYELGVAGIRVILTEGWRSFWRRAKSYSAQRSGGAGLEIRPLKIMSLDSKKPVATSDKRVSIVIPTKNAGTDFVSTLKQIRNQIGIREVELVIVDSGSTDDTVKLAKDYAATVHSVKPSEFNHGLTRNYAADRSSGDYILFMVQDAVPIGNHWLFDMVNVLEIGNGVTAVTCRQVPRDDADLFARYSLWTYYRAMEFSRDEVRMTNSKFDDLPPREKRRLCALEDVCCLIRKDVFEKFKFKNIQYAEDLELGVRLQRAGHKIAFLYSVGVIHSHNRSASYHLPRRYVESKLLPEILAYEPVYRYCDIPSINDLMSCIMTAYATLNMSVSSLRPFGENACAAISRVKALLQNRTRNNSIALNNYGRSGGYLDGPFDELMKIVETMPNPRSNDLIKESYFAALDGLALYVAQNGPVKGKENEFIDALYKIFAMVAGSALADYYMFKSRKGEISQVLSAVDRALSTGV